MRIFSNIREIFESIRHGYYCDLLARLNTGVCREQKALGFIQWIENDLISQVNDFVNEHGLEAETFMQGLGNTFNTNRFSVLLKKWLIEYFSRLYLLLSESSFYLPGKYLVLEDNIVNRFGVSKYESKFGKLPAINWQDQPSFVRRWLDLNLKLILVLFLSLKNGLKIFSAKQRFKVMREALWQLYDGNGYYFHDDFIVDGKKIKSSDLLLFSRGIPKSKDRLNAYADALKSPFKHFVFGAQPISLAVFIFRILPKYLVRGGWRLLLSMNSSFYTLFSSLFGYFVKGAIPYEAAFSNFEVTSELGHSYFLPSHIAEAIVCRNYNTKYYFLQWADNSISANKNILSYLGCDAHLIWGRAHAHAVEGVPCVPIGYPFKRVITKVRNTKAKIMAEIGIKPSGKIITFFDESVGGYCRMTAESFVSFWGVILKTAQQFSDHTVVVKPKKSAKHNYLPGALADKLKTIQANVQKLDNYFELDPEKWSFVEAIGISDLVITEGMTSTSTIALVCGIDALYLDEAHYDHRFTSLYKDQIVFDNPDRMLLRIRDIIDGKFKPSQNIPEHILREYDRFADDRGIDLLVEILASGKEFLLDKEAVK